MNKNLQSELEIPYYSTMIHMLDEYKPMGTPNMLAKY